MIDPPSPDARAYLLAINAAAIYITITEKQQQWKLGIAYDLNRALQFLKKNWAPDAALYWVAWVNSINDANTLHSVSPYVIRDGNRKVVVSAEEMIEAIKATAHEKHIVLTPYSAAVQRAENLAGKVKELFNKLGESGELKAFNQSYRQHRLYCGLRGVACRSYGDELARLQILIIKTVNENADNQQAIAILRGKLFSEFPWFTVTKIHSKAI